MSNTETLSEQVNQMVTDLQHLRVKSENDDKTIHLMREQYDGLAASVEALAGRHEREIHAMRTERDQAVRRFKSIDTLLLQASNIIMQALRARSGDDTPEQIPDRPVGVVGHPLLPVAEFDDGIRQLVRTMR